MLGNVARVNEMRGKTDVNGQNIQGDGAHKSRPRIKRHPRPLQTGISNTRRILVVLVLAMGGFGIGTTEFVSMGLLPMISGDLGISEEQASHIISAYAMGVVVGAPLITALTGKIPRRRLLIILMAAFIIGNALGIFAENYTVLMIARFIAGLPHGAYFSVAGLSAPRPWLQPVRAAKLSPWLAWDYLWQRCLVFPLPRHLARRWAGKRLTC